MLNIKPTSLEGNWVELIPFNETHKEELYQAAQDSRIWTFNLTKAHGEKFYPWFQNALLGFQKNLQLPFVVRRKSDQKILGSTRFYDIHFEHHRLTIGFTWYIPEVWGTYVNPECKLLLLQFAFEECDVNRVEFVTDSRNARSRAAIKKLGAREEGILRQHMILEDGHVRDSVIFSIIKPDWLEIKSKLNDRLIQLK